MFISNQKSKVISVSLNGINSYINLYSTLNEKDYSICKNISYSLFICELKENGIYSFKYNYTEKNEKIEMKLNQKVGILNSIDDFFNIEISRNVPCYSNKENVAYTLTPKNTFTTDNIQIVIDKKYYFEKNNNVYTLYQEINPSLNSYLRIIENDEDDDIL